MPVPEVPSVALEASETSTDYENQRSLTDIAAGSSSSHSSLFMPDATSRWYRERYREPYREAPTPSVTRASRASSIVSTHTKTSITTLDTPGTIDLPLGRENFRIAREGSIIEITRDDVPAPPYDAPFIAATPIVIERPEYPAAELQRPITSGQGVEPRAPVYESLHTPQPFQQRERENSLPSMRGERNDISSPATEHEEQQTNNASSPSSEAAINRSPSYNPGSENLSVSWRRASSSSVATEDLSGSAKARLRRRNGVRLKLVTRTSNDAHGQTSSPVTPGSAVSSSSARSGCTLSAGTTPVRSDDISETSSPIHIEKGAAGLFPHTAVNALGVKGSELSTTGTFTANPSYIDKDFVEGLSPPPMDTVDEIRTHYNRLLRTIDRNYRIELHARDKDMSKLRERINEIDQVYRMELRARDLQMEERMHARDKELRELRKRVRLLENQECAAVDGLRNEAEDMWQLRWKDAWRSCDGVDAIADRGDRRDIENSRAGRGEEW
ncbi:hypothetical protein MMC16_004606 [Acarospora aff. strigata]|nr:hypothetical protein [Acarospora aff. strigata]